jgi:signal transduction histidine kinase
MVVLRRVTVLVVLGAIFFQKILVPDGAGLSSPVYVGGVVCLYNELGYWLFTRARRGRGLAVVNVQVAADILTFTAILHSVGGITSPGVFFFVPIFFVYGAVLPLPHGFVHVAAMAGELTALWAAERAGVLVPRGSVVYSPGMLVLTLATLSGVSALCTYMSHQLARLLRKQEEQARRLEAERIALVASNEREAARVRALIASNEVEAARVRALLDVAQLVSGTHSVEELLRAVCDTTVALVRVPRVEVFLWDGEQRSLRLAAARGLSHESYREREVRYPAEIPIVARLRAGEVVDFGAVLAQTHMPVRAAIPFRRGFAAPMLCRGSFEGALFVGYDDEGGGEVKELVQGLARQAAVALVNVRAMEQQQEDAEVSGGLLQISQALSACLDEEALWTLVARGASEVLGLPWVVAGRFDERSGTFEIAGAQGVPEIALVSLTKARFRLEDFPVLQELLSSRELVVPDEQQPPPFTVPEGWNVGGWMAIPLFRGSWVAGFLAAGSEGGGRPLTRRQLRLIEGMGQHASIALQNARLVADLEAADKLKSEFVSTMSHELRTPLNVIIGYTEMLRERAAGPVTAAQLDLINRLDARGRELLELIEATLHVGRIEAGRDLLEVTTLELPDLVRALQASAAGLPRAPGVALEWEVPEVRKRVVTDRAKLALVVRNLVSNAFKFTSEGKVIVRLAVRDDTLLVEVRDTGIGISEEHLPIIFEMFRQVDGSSTRRHGGVGLGLYIVKQFVGRLGGTVDVKSTFGRGSTFRVMLPGVVQDAAESAAA